MTRILLCHSARTVLTGQRVPCFSAPMEGQYPGHVCAGCVCISVKLHKTAMLSGDNVVRIKWVGRKTYMCPQEKGYNINIIFN